MNSDELGSECIRALHRRETSASYLGIELLDAGHGRAKVAMIVTDRMLNPHGTCHGAFIFALADTAFSYACNSNDEKTVAQQCQITYLAPVQVHEQLIADARERSRTGRSGVYDVTVSDENSRVVAEFRGLSRTVGGSFLKS